MVKANVVNYEELAYFLADSTQALSVLLPNKVKHFAQSPEQEAKRTNSMPACLPLGLSARLAGLATNYARPAPTARPFPCTAEPPPAGRSAQNVTPCLLA